MLISHPCTSPARRSGALVLLSGLLGASLAAGTRDRSQKRELTNSPLVVHEWGTFTSIAGLDGNAVHWLPLRATSDLPAFVEHIQNAVGKGSLGGTVRMETPVIYFYSPEEMIVSVQVSFAQGIITEWYPHGTLVQRPDAPRIYALNAQTRGGIAWNEVSVAPKLAADFPREPASSHYYAARETSATPISISAPGGNRHEKFLFYRGVSVFAPPMSAAVLSATKLRLENRSSQPIPAVILFERRGDRVGYRVLPSLDGEINVETPSNSGTGESLRSELEAVLAAQGLFADEAKAMLETWRVSWFEEGSRIFYIVPKSFVESVLPLTIRPIPARVERVFIGRIELLTQGTEEAIEAGLLSHDHESLR